MGWKPCHNLNALHEVAAPAVRYEYQKPYCTSVSDTFRLWLNDVVFISLSKPTRNDAVKVHVFFLGNKNKDNV